MTDPKTIKATTDAVWEFLKRKGARTSKNPEGWTRKLTGAVGYGVKPDDITWERLAAVTDYPNLIVHQVLVLDDPTLRHLHITILVSDHNEQLGIPGNVERGDQQ